MHVAGNKLDRSAADNAKTWKKKLSLGGKQCHYEHALLERISRNNSCAPRNMRVSLPLKNTKPEYEKDTTGARIPTKTHLL